ncbi:hypothetical protein Nepgr_001441 [Nepenthes gracilis]|uniref:Uncharacterized protein n=1 Tax=Nepenthes gracilis TaxID=150966 RepID=A0AAD3P8I6_NEPGR|nr:hypothetical protein Nepgr_001441 [Nepenthes gracilis]
METEAEKKPSQKLKRWQKRSRFSSARARRQPPAVDRFRFSSGQVTVSTLVPPPSVDSLSLQIYTKCDEIRRRFRNTSTEFPTATSPSSDLTFISHSSLLCMTSRKQPHYQSQKDCTEQASAGSQCLNSVFTC